MSIGSCTTWNSAPNLAKEYYNLGQTYFDLKKYTDSAHAYKIAINLDPSLTVAHLNLVRALAEQNDLEGAWTFLQPLLKKDPDNLVLLKVKAYLLWLRGKKEESSILWKELAKKLPADAETQFNFAYVASEEKWDDEAWQALIRYADLGGQEPRAWNMLGSQALKREKWTRALQAFTQVTKLDPKNAVALADLSKVYVNLERFDDAAQALRKAIEVEDAQANQLVSGATTGVPGATANYTSQPPANTQGPLSPQPATGSVTSTVPSSTATPGTSAPATPAGSTPTTPEVPANANATSTNSSSPTQSKTLDGAHKGQWSFRLGTILLYGMEDYPGAIEAFRTAWKSGWTDPKVWTKLLAVPDLPQKIRLEADLTTLGVFGSKS